MTAYYKLYLEQGYYNSYVIFEEAMETCLFMERFGYHPTKLVEMCQQTEVDTIQYRDGHFTRSNGFSRFVEFDEDKYARWLTWRRNFMQPGVLHQVRQFDKDTLKPVLDSALPSDVPTVINTNPLDLLLKELKRDLEITPANCHHIFQAICDDDLEYVKATGRLKCGVRGVIRTRFAYVYNSALELSALMGRNRITRWLMENVKFPERNVQSALCYVAERGDLEMVKFFYDWDYYLPVYHPFHGNTEFGKFHKLEYTYAKIGYSDDKHCNVFYWLTRNGHHDIVNYCLHNTDYCLPDLSDIYNLVEDPEKAVIEDRMGLSSIRMFRPDDLEKYLNMIDHEWKQEYCAESQI